MSALATSRAPAAASCAQDSIARVRSLHGCLQLAGLPPNALLELPDNLLAYLLHLLHDEVPPVLPAASAEAWQGWLRALDSHGIGPLLYRAAGRLPAHLHPPLPVMHVLRGLFLSSRAAQLLTDMRLHKLTGALRAAGLRVLVLKGPHLARTAYADPALRPSADIDLLVRPRDFLQARALLVQQGFACLERRFEHFRAFEYEEVFLHARYPRDACLVELHWDLLRFAGRAMPRDAEALFDQAQTVRADRLEFEALDPVDALWYAAVHLTLKHPRSLRLLWLCDIALLARRLTGPADRLLLQETCSREQAVLSVLAALEMAQAWFGQVPDGLLERGSWPAPAPDERRAWQFATGARGFVPLFAAGVLRSGAGIGILLRYGLRLLFPAPGLMRFNHPPPHRLLLPLSYVRRWLRWLCNI